MYHFYGPTEASINATYWHCQRGDNEQNPPIGYPIANTQIYLLDNQQQPVPIGTTGELHIGGVGLARCYLNQPAATAEKFIPDPFAKDAGARLYKTGDVARHLPNGALEFVGRLDQQVKIRGFRVELNEIEKTLLQHPAVRDGVVLFKNDSPEPGKLIGYIVSREEAPTPATLRAFLRNRLPDFMVPAEYLVIESLPLTRTGKIDRNALLALSTESPAEQEYVAPRTALEEVLAEMGAELLQIERVGVNDNFFDMGGHSLLATQFVSRVRKLFRVQIPLRAFFETPSVAGLSRTLIASEARPGEAEKIARAVQKIKAMSTQDIHVLLKEKRASINS